MSSSNLIDTKFCWETMACKISLPDFIDSKKASEKEDEIWTFPLNFHYKMQFSSDRKIWIAAVN